MKLAKWIQCEGEAHSNAFIDHCAVCMPYWGRYPVCPVDGQRLGTVSGYCRGCGKYYNVQKGSENVENPNSSGRNQSSTGSVEQGTKRGRRTGRQRRSSSGTSSKSKRSK